MALRPTKVTRTVAAKDEIDDEVEEIIKPPKRGSKPALEVEDDEEDEEEVVAPVKSSKKVAAPVPAAPVRKARPIVEDDEDEYDEEEEVVKPVKKAALVAQPAVKPGKITKSIVVPPPPAKPAKVAKPVVEDDEDEEEAKPVVKVKSVQSAVVDGLFEKLLTSLEDGKVIFIKKVGDDKWQISQGEAPVAVKATKFAGQEYWREITSDEFNKWQEDWKQLTYAEKVQKANKAGVKWDQHTNPKVDVMRLTEAYRSHMGIEKYKPEYQSRAARQALRTTGN